MSIGGPEAMFLAIAMLVVVAAVVAVVRRSVPPTTDTSRTIVVADQGHEWLDGVVAGLGTLRNHDVERLADHTVVVTWRRRSGWVYVVALLTFPLGLLALLFTTTDSGTITVADAGPPGRIRIGGVFSRVAVDEVNAHIPDPLAPPSPPTPPAVHTDHR